MSLQHQDEQGSVLILASEHELPSAERIWGTGGWLPPEQREALDWLTLTRLLGWRVDVALASELETVPKDVGSVIVACSMSQARREIVTLLTQLVAKRPLVVIVRALGADNDLMAFAGVRARAVTAESGRELRWIGPGEPLAWTCHSRLSTVGLDPRPGTEAWATLGGEPLITAREAERGRVAALGFHPSDARDRVGAATGLLRELLIRSSKQPAAWLDLGGIVVLRMDDPGGAQNVHSRRWCYPKLREGQWKKLCNQLERHDARLAIGYVGGWVDDGDAERGRLWIEGRAQERRPGRVHPSPLVRYEDVRGNAPGSVSDYESEYRGIQALRRAGRGDVELHGYTHMHPDTEAWAEAPDRYDSVYWFRELAASAGDDSSSPLRRRALKRGLSTLRRFFGVEPTTLICPGDEWTTEALEVALDLRLGFVSSYYMALRWKDRFCWATHVRAPYFDEPSADHLESGLPVVGYFHDLEPSRHGTDWFARWITRWEASGARRFVDFRELAGGVFRTLVLRRNPWRLRVASDNAPRLVRPLKVGLWSSGEPPPASIEVELGDRSFALDVEHAADGSAYIEIPPE